MNKKERNKKRKQKELLVAKATAYQAGIDGRIISRDKESGLIVAQADLLKDARAELAVAKKAKKPKAIEQAGKAVAEKLQAIALKKGGDGIYRLSPKITATSPSDICTDHKKGGDKLFSGIYNRTIFTGDQNHETDNLEVMRDMDSQSVDLIYLDPPFNSKRDYFAPFDSDAEDLGAFFSDTFARDNRWHGLQDIILNQNKAIYAAIKSGEQASGKSAGSYLTFMAVRLMELHRLLKPTGSIYLHCDPTMSHYLKALMDAVFGKSNYRNEISWCYRKWTNAATHWQKNKDIILFYSKTDNYCFNKQFDPNAPQAKKYMRGWDTNRVKGVKQLIVYDEEKAREQIKAKKYDRLVMRLDTIGTAMGDWWRINYLSSGSKERTGYPTQKPVALLERIVKASSKKGDIIFDPFCGCGTACDAAEKEGRRWIGIDAAISAGAVMVEKRKGIEDKRHLVNWRMVNAKGEGMPKRTDDGETAIEYKPPTKTLRRDNKAMDAYKIFEVQKNGGVQCWVTGKKDHADNLVVDHIIPKREAERLGWDNAQWNNWDNFQIVAPDVNSSKGEKMMDEFLLHWEAKGGALSPEASKRIRQIKKQRDLIV